MLKNSITPTGIVAKRDGSSIRKLSVFGSR
jgi:hypothetical protein